MNDVQLARYLGYFSLGLGALELVLPGRIARLLGLPVPNWAVAAFGARELGAGMAVLTFPDSPGPVWARVGGDVLDLAVLAAALGRTRGRRHDRALLATLAVVGVTAADILCATALTARERRAHQTAQRTRIRDVRPKAALAS